ncbi:arsenate reductase family protein [uncultured Roseovarius sp.]|uniref:arsenate reductase family protein n=1 Tax=uncultured Roseovarius sp. TaxID=293344 RepID=UPI0026366E6A|nr:ArsC/Spx/MgsR family protein [uncultured Roseovarius sp.]
MIIYGLKNCDTCRKALKSLPEAQLCDVHQDGVPDDVLKSAYATFGAALVNTRSTTWRGLSEAERALDPMELLRVYPALMKRPLIDHNNQLYLGWTKDVQSALLG